jgi:hypothetical protein
VKRKSEEFELDLVKKVLLLKRKLIPFSKSKIYEWKAKGFTRSYIFRKWKLKKSTTIKFLNLVTFHSTSRLWLYFGNEDVSFAIFSFSCDLSLLVQQFFFATSVIAHLAAVFHTEFSHHCLVIKARVSRFTFHSTSRLWLYFGNEDVSFAIFSFSCDLSLLV